MNEAVRGGARIEAARTTAVEGREKDRAGWGGPVLVMAARLPLVVLGLLLLAGVFLLAGEAHPWARALDHFRVVFALFADLGALLILAWLVRREGRRLRDLVGYDRGRLGRDLLTGLGVFVLFATVFGVAPILGSLVAYGSPDAGAAWASFGALSPPSWVLWWAVLVNPVTTGVVEELIFRGYATPRILDLTGRA